MMNRIELETIVRTVTEAVLREIGHAHKERTGCGNCTSCPCKSEKGKSASSPVPSVSPPTPAAFEGRLLSEEALLSICRPGCMEVHIRPGTLVTPLARDRAQAMGVSFVTAQQSAEDGRTVACSTDRRLTLVARNCSRSMEQAVVSTAGQAGFQVQVEPINGRTNSAVTEAALASARALSRQECRRGIIIDDNIYALSLQMGRISGVRPAVCWDVDSAIESRRECNSNVLLLSSRLMGLTAVRRIVSAWLNESES